MKQFASLYQRLTEQQTVRPSSTGPLVRKIPVSDLRKEKVTGKGAPQPRGWLRRTERGRGRLRNEQEETRDQLTSQQHALFVLCLVLFG